jgi:tight adherence protein C
MDSSIIIAIVAFILLLAGLTWFGYKIFYKPGRMLRQLGNPVIADNLRRPVVETGTGSNEPEASTVVTVLHQLGSKVPSSEADIATLRAQLIRGGFRSENGVTVFYGLRLVSTAACLGMGLMLVPKMPDNPSMQIAMVISSLCAGWIMPRFFLEKKVAKRQEILRLSLPDALDLLVVSVEAGLGLDQAIQHVARELNVSHPQLSEEMSLVTLEMRAGKRRSEALKNFADRTGEPEISKLVAILIQNDRFGTSMGESLRTHSDFMRTKRRQEAEERAAKVGVKLVFPIFFFILPSMLIVAAGPGILQIFKYLFPMMRRMGG